MNIRPILKDTLQEQNLEKYGYAKFPFFDADEVNQLSRLTQQLDGKFNTAFTSTI